MRREQGSVLCWGAGTKNHLHHGRPRQIQRLKATEGRHIVVTGIWGPL